VPNQAPWHKIHRGSGGTFPWILNFDTKRWLLVMFKPQPL